MVHSFFNPGRTHPPQLKIVRGSIRIRGFGGVNFNICILQLFWVRWKLHIDMLVDGQKKYFWGLWRVGPARVEEWMNHVLMTLIFKKEFALKLLSSEFESVYNEQLIARGGTSSGGHGSGNLDLDHQISIGFDERCTPICWTTGCRLSSVSGAEWGGGNVGWQITWCVFFWHSLKYQGTLLVKFLKFEWI